MTYQPAKVGRIHLHDKQGNLVYVADYDTPVALRSRQITYNNIVYEQAWQRIDHIWVYRELEPSSKFVQNTMGLINVKAAHEPINPPSWDDVDRWFAKLRGTSEPVPMSSVSDLESLIVYLRGKLEEEKADV